MCKIQTKNYQVLAALTSGQTALKRVPNPKDRSTCRYHRIILHNDYPDTKGGEIASLSYGNALGVYYGAATVFVFSCN